LFLFLGEKACRYFAALAVIVQTFTADSMLVAGIGARTKLLIDFCPWALVLLLHGFPSWIEAVTIA